MITSRICRIGDTSSIEINGVPAIPYGYMSYQPAKADYPGFREAGVRLFFTSVFAGDRGINPNSGIKPFRPGFWKAKGEFDFSAADEDFRLIVGDAKPGEVFIIPRLMLEPPRFWEAENPDELCRDFEGKSVHQSYSSPVWLRDTVDAMEHFQAWLTESGWDRYIAGWHLAGGHTEEFMRPNLHRMQYTDYSKRSLEAYRLWLREKYGSIDELNRAWGMTLSDFSQVTIPTPAQRSYPVSRSDAHRPTFVADHARFYSVENARAICDLAREAKRITGGQRVIGAFYGYCGLANGHQAVDMILESPDVDFLASPFSYGYNRAPGIDWIVGGAVASCRLHNMTWFMECDVRTHLSRPIRTCMPFANPEANDHYDKPVWYGPESEHMSIEQMKKAWAKSLCTGCSLWWFDMWGGWYKTGDMMDFHKKARKVYEDAMNRGMRSAAQIAFCADDHNPEQMVGGDNKAAIAPLSTVGAPFDNFTLSDLPLIDPSKYRVLILSGVVGTQLPASLDRWLKDGRSVVFTRSPGLDAYFDEAGASQPVNGTDDASGEIIVRPDCQLYRFRGTPETQRLQDTLLAAGAHIYNFDGEVIYAASDMVAIHAVSTGNKRIWLPFKGQLEDVFTGETLENCDQYTNFHMEMGHTRVFRIRKI